MGGADDDAAALEAARARCISSSSPLLPVRHSFFVLQLALALPARARNDVRCLESRPCFLRIEKREQRRGNAGALPAHERERERKKKCFFFCLRKRKNVEKQSLIFSLSLSSSTFLSLSRLAFFSLSLLSPKAEIQEKQVNDALHPIPCRQLRDLV